jgi:hypothetical protein
MSELTGVLGSSHILVDPDSAMQRFHKEAKDLAQFQCPSSRTVGFVGDSGVGTLYHKCLHSNLTNKSYAGKSSLMNSLLDFRGLARAVSRSQHLWIHLLISIVKSNSGAACTCVVTEYHYHDSDKFTVEIEAFCTDEITEQMTTLLDSYRHYHLHQMDMDRDERQDFEKKANVARDTFRAMFRDRLDSEQFLIDEPQDVVLEKAAVLDA